MDWLANSVDASIALIPFAAFFSALALLTKSRGQAVADARRAAGEWRTNLLIFLFDTLVVLPYVALPSVWLVSAIGTPTALIQFWAGLPVALTAIAAVVFGDYVGYWRHRLEHVPLLWRFHATHHSDRELNWFSLNRMHPVDRLVTATVDTVILALAGFPFWAIVLNGIVRNGWGYFIHADVRWTLGSAGLLVISPSAHRWHHVRDETMAGTNFATVFTLWDRLHGTWQPSPRPCLEPTGVEGHSCGFVYEMIEPFGLWPKPAEDIAAGARFVET